MHPSHAMKVVCAWCQAEGCRMWFEKEPWDDPSETHGVCPRHKAQLVGRPDGPLDRPPDPPTLGP
jgi:hypothetical protein